MRALRLDEASEQGRSANNFDVLRLLAALCVTLAHAFALTGNQPFWPHGTGIEWGNLGVLIFFSMSGYLVARSWSYDPRLLGYLVKRGLRLMPALVVTLILTAFVLGPFVTSVEPTSAYLQAPGTKSYVVLNASMWTSTGLPGIFPDNPVPDIANGNLWTLALEVKAYLIVALLGLLGLFRRRGGIGIAVVALLAAALLIDPVRNALPLANRAAAVLHTTIPQHEVVQGAHDGEIYPWIQLFAAFSIGAALYAMRRRVVLRWDVALLFVAIFAGSVALGEHQSRVVATWLIPYVVLVAAYLTPRRLGLPSRWGDYSYGIYLVSWPILQTVETVIDTGNGWFLFLSSLPFIVGVAVVSWHIVEAPALTLKTRLARPLARAGAAAKRRIPREELEPVRVG
jgi:peptidoglycan/LPS O-acetylase OafA/YrhL